MYFVTIPSFRVEGRGSAVLDNELIREIRVTSENVVVSVNPEEVSDITSDGKFDTYKILEFNDVIEHLHYQAELDDLITDLAYFASMDFLQAICHDKDLIGVLFAQAPPGNPYIAMMQGNWYPFPVQRPEGIVIPELVRMGKFSSNYFVKVQQFVVDDLTLQFENTIATFRENVIQSLEMQESLGEKEARLILQQARNLTTILEDYLLELDDRYQHLMNMITPMMLKESLVKELECHVTYFYHEGDLSANPRSQISLNAKELADFIKRKVEEFLSS